MFGAAIGSFLNVVILRLPEGKSLGGRSHCPHCHHVLGVFDLLPIVSFLFLRRRCRYCGKKISPRYVAIELCCGFLFMLGWFVLRPDNAAGMLLLIKYWFVISVLIAVFVIDLEHYLILDNIIFPSLAIAVVLNLALTIVAGRPILLPQAIFISGLLGAFLGALPFWLIWFLSKGQWMGFGDVKLALFLGMALGLPLVFVGIIFAVLAGGVASVFLLASKAKTLKSRVPFGTFLSLGAIVGMFWGERLLHWYLAILGF